MSTHTPGPWYVEFDGWRSTGKVDLHCTPVRADDHQPADAYGRSKSESEANARLIAAAPDMDLLLRALRCGVAKWYEPTGEFRFDGLMYATAANNDWSRLCEIVGRPALEKAIAKAEGR